MEFWELMRRRHSGGTELPYDAEIEYLQSSGTQYIDSGIRATGDLSYKCEVACTSRNVAGAIYKTGNTYIRHHLAPTNATNFHYNTGNTGNTGVSTNDVFYTYALNVTTGKCTKNTTDYNFTPATFDCYCNFGIFGRISSDSTLYDLGYCKIKYFEISVNGTKVRDFIPVRVGSIGYMYDKVSGQLFGNAGTGNFILGNDK